MELAAALDGEHDAKQELVQRAEEGLHTSSGNIIDSIFINVMLMSSSERGSLIGNSANTNIASAYLNQEVTIVHSGYYHYA